MASQRVLTAFELQSWSRLNAIAAFDSDPLTAQQIHAACELPKPSASHTRLWLHEYATDGVVIKSRANKNVFFRNASPREVATFRQITQSQNLGKPRFVRVAQAAGLAA